MIISASRRTDIPAFYAEWFINRIREQKLFIRNPIYVHQVSEIDLSPEVIDCIVFWTKDPGGILPYLDELDQSGYKYYFQYTITPYNHVWEKYVPDLEARIHSFQELSKKIGKEKIIWRYDPIFLSPDISVEFHQEYFTSMIDKIAPYTKKIIISFLDYYKKIDKVIQEKKIYSPLADADKLHKICSVIGQISKQYNLSVETCTEEIDLSPYGIMQGKCIDDTLIETITGKKFKNSKKDPNQRACCGCITSIDIGAYDTCLHGCEYCYATCQSQRTLKNVHKHNISSPLLIGNLSEKDIISQKTMRSFLVNPEDVPLSLF